MSLATKSRAQASMACEMGFASMVRVASVGRLWYKSAAQTSQNRKSVPQIVRYGYAPDVTAPRGMVCGHRPINRKGGELRRPGDVPERNQSSR
jgi:hypothetical protein